MKEPDKEQEPIKVRDRRRFDAEGNVRKETADSGNGEAATESRPTASAPSPGRAATEEASKLQQDLEAARKRVDELARAFQALNADREDFKQRLTRERERMVDIEKANIASVLLEVLDELDLSLNASAEDESPLASGVRLIRDGLLTKLQAMGIERLNVAVGSVFDPTLAEATDTDITANSAEDGKVTMVVRAGYRLKDRVIRPARVRVARYMSPAEA